MDRILNSTNKTKSETRAHNRDEQDTQLCKHKKDGNTYTQSILGVNKHKITQDGQRIYTINTRLDQAQNNSRRATHIHNQY